MRALIIPIILTWFFCIYYCSEGPTAPILSSHNYEWTIDTITPPPDAMQFIKEDIWGSDENNVWVVGHSDLTKYQILHWNGERWDFVYHRFPGHRPSFTGIFGFSENDIWIVGEENVAKYPDFYHRSFIARYDGNTWHHFKEIKETSCINVWGYSSSDLYVGCDSGLILYFDGSEWEKQSTNTDAVINSIFGTIEGEVYAIGYEVDSEPYLAFKYFFFKKNGIGWTTIDSFKQVSINEGKFGSKLWISQDEKIYSTGKGGLFLRNNKTWSHLFGNNIFAVFGTSDNNIFVGGWANSLYHFNGNDWHSYDSLKNEETHIYDIWANKNHVFLMTSHPWLMYRGKRVK